MNTAPKQISNMKSSSSSTSGTNIVNSQPQLIFQTTATDDSQPLAQPTATCFPIGKPDSRRCRRQPEIGSRGAVEQNCTVLRTSFFEEPPLTFAKPMSYVIEPFFSETGPPIAKVNIIFQNDTLKVVDDRTGQP